MRRTEAESLASRWADCEPEAYESFVGRIRSVAAGCRDSESEDEYGIVCTVVRRYGTSVEHITDAQIRRAISINTVDTNRRTRWTQRTSEKYWEYQESTRALADWLTQRIEAETRAEERRNAEHKVDLIRQQLSKLTPSERAWVIKQFLAFGVEVPVSARDKKWIDKKIRSRARAVREKNAKDRLKELLHAA